MCFFAGVKRNGCCTYRILRIFRGTASAVEEKLRMHRATFVPVPLGMGLVKFAEGGLVLFLWIL